MEISIFLQKQMNQYIFFIKERFNEKKNKIFRIRERLNEKSRCLMRGTDIRFYYFIHFYDRTIRIYTSKTRVESI